MYKSAKELRDVGWKRIREHNNYWGVCLLAYLFLVVMEVLYIAILFWILSLLFKQGNSFQDSYYRYPYEYMSDQKTSMIFSLFSSSLSIAMLLLSAPLQLGMAKVSLAAARGQKVSVKDLFFGFGGGRFWKSVGLSVSNSILIVLWSFVLIIPGIVKTFEYALSFYVLADHPEMGINEARRESMSLMTGNKGRLFRLELSWIGWGLLCVATLGILMLWVLPAAQICLGAFYCDTRLEDLEGNAKTSGSQNIKADPFQYFSRYSSSAPVRSNPPAPSEIAPSDNRPQPPEAGEPDAAETPLQNGEESLSAVATRTPLPPSDAGDGKNESEE